MGRREGRRDGGEGGTERAPSPHSLLSAPLPSSPTLPPPSLPQREGGSWEGRREGRREMLILI